MIGFHSCDQVTLHDKCKGILQVTELNKREIVLMGLT